MTDAEIQKRVKMLFDMMVVDGYTDYQEFKSLIKKSGHFEGDEISKAGTYLNILYEKWEADKARVSPLRAVVQESFDGLKSNEKRNSDLAFMEICKNKQISISMRRDVRLIVDKLCRNHSGE